MGGGTRVLVTSVLITFPLLEPFSDAYWLSLAMYYESRDEGLVGRYAVANVVYNRMHDNRWPPTVKGVITDGLERGRSCDFSFMCDGKPEVPWLHHYSRWSSWIAIRMEGFILWLLESANIRYDPTHGAVFYKRFDVYSPWFEKEIKAGRMRKVAAELGAHEFYK